MPLINPDTLDLKEQVVRTNKVQKTHKGGRTMSWSVLIVVGDGEGHVGAGIGKARAIPDAIRKGVEAAKKNLVLVPMVGSTIPHEVLSRVAAAEVLLRPASPGTGVVAGGSVRAILEAAGVRDVLAKSLGSSNPVNGAWATLDALRRLKRADNIARLRGKEVLELVSKQVAAASGIDVGYVPSSNPVTPNTTIDHFDPQSTPIVAQAQGATDASPVNYADNAPMNPETAVAPESNAIAAENPAPGAQPFHEPTAENLPERGERSGEFHA